MIAFWILAPIMVLAALGILFVRKAVHAALLLAVVMMSLAVLYAVLWTRRSSSRCRSSSTPAPS